MTEIPLHVQASFRMFAIDDIERVLRERSFELAEKNGVDDPTRRLLVLLANEFATTRDLLKDCRDKDFAASGSFPMQHGPAIPWALAEIIYAAYSAVHCTNQSLEKLAERGGFGWSEVTEIFKDYERQFGRQRTVEILQRAGEVRWSTWP